MRDTKNNFDSRPSAPDYTAACVVMFGVNLVFMLAVIWAKWGLLAVVFVSFFINKAIDRIEAARR